MVQLVLFFKNIKPDISDFQRYQIWLSRGITLTWHCTVIALSYCSVWVFLYSGGLDQISLSVPWTTLLNGTLGPLEITWSFRFVERVLSADIWKEKSLSTVNCCFLMLFDIFLYQIIGLTWEFDVSKGTIKCNAWHSVCWYNSVLLWVPRVTIIF